MVDEFVEVGHELVDLFEFEVVHLNSNGSTDVDHFDVEVGTGRVDSGVEGGVLEEIEEFLI